MSKIATKALIDEKITGNGVQAITGPILNNVLNTMVDDYGTQDEVSQLAQKLYGNHTILLNDITTAPSTVYITADMVSPGDVLVFELESLNNLQGVLKAEKTGYVHDRYISVAAGQTATVSYTVPQDFLRIYTTSSANPMKVTCSYDIPGDIDELQADGSVTTQKIADGAVTRAKLSADVVSTIDSPFTLDGAVVGNHKAVFDVKVYTTNPANIGSIYRIGRLKRVNGEIYVTFTKDGTNVANISLSSYTPTTTRNIFTIGNADNSIIAQITFDWSVFTDGTDITPNYQIKGGNVVLVENMNHIFLRTASTTPSYVSESFKELELTILEDADLTKNYYLYSFRKSGGTFLCRVYKGTETKLIEQTYTTGNEVLEVEVFNIKAKIDLSVVPEGASLMSYQLAFIVKRGKLERNEATDGYLQKDTIINIGAEVFYVDCNRTSNSGQWFKSISEACAHIRSISPAKHQKQFEVVVMPGVYHEAGILLPPYTHVHGTSKDSVIVTDTDYNGEDSSCLFDFGTAGNVPWQSSGRYAKLSNLTLRETQGRYCIHASQPYMCGLLENVAFEHHLCTTGDRAYNDMVIGVGCGYSGNLFTFDGCSFKSFGHKGKVTGHTVQLTVYGNCRLNFKNCVFVNSDIYWLSIGSCGNLIINVEGCSFLSGSELIAGFTANAIQPYAYQSDLYEINFIGGHNKNLIANLPCAGSAVCVELDTATEGDVIYLSGSIADALFGGINYKIGGNSVKAKATGTLYVADEKNASNQDVFQMWKRLGDCSSVPKTLTVNINGVTQTVTLNGNYSSSKPAETSIIAEINAQLTGCTFKKVAITDRYSKLNMAEKELIFCGQDMAKFACVDKDGIICPANSADVYGIVLEETAKNDIAPVWTGFGLYTGMADGSYAVGANGVLVASANHVVYNCTDGVLTRA